jgi:hypothetical protein|tara:strand:- start:121 stop:294 length:174 start_codon:yes stop_codon:yes gene_type:complete
MTAAERLKKRFKGGVPHKADKEKVIPYGYIAGPRIRKRKSGRNETKSRTRKIGYDFF